MPWLRRNVELLPPRALSRWRNLSLAAWSTVSDATVPAAAELDAEPALAFLERECERTGRRITMTHFVGKAVADTLRHLPDVNCMIRLGRIHPRRDVDVFFPVALDSRGEDLSGVVLRDVDRMTLPEVSEALTREVYALRKHGVDAWGLKSRGPLAQLASRFVLRAAGFFLYSLNLWTPLLGIPRDAFGSVAVTDLSQFGAEYAFPPLLPVSRLPLLVGVGGVFDGGVWEDDAWRRRKRVRLAIVFDHRVIDGVYASRAFRHMAKVFAEPERYLASPGSSGPETPGS